MSQRDLTAELRASRITAPTELRERVRLIAATDTTRPTRRFAVPQLTLRRALVVALPVAAAVAAGIVFTRPSDHRQAVGETVIRSAPAGAVHGSAVPNHSAKTLPQPAPADSATSGAGTGAARIAVPSTPGRVQVYGAYLALRLQSATAVSDGVKRALAIASSLGGYPVSVQATSRAKDATADLTLKIPRDHVQAAIARLSALGTITSEQVEIQDKESGLNATDRLIGRLQAQLKQLRSEATSPITTARIAALEAQIARLQRREATVRRAAHYATVHLQLTSAKATVAHTKRHGPLHGVVVALTWIGIGAVYVLAVGAPLALLAGLLWLGARSIRRRREDALLSRP